MDEQRLYLIDATAFCYRAFYALQGLATSFGQPTNAVFGFIRLINKLIKDEQPQYVAVCFDVSRKTVRQEKFADYKGTRPPMPEGLVSQIPYIKELVGAYNMALFEQEGYEADDMIASLAKKAKDLALKAVIVTADKDMLQLVGDTVTVLNPGKDEAVIYDQKRVMERYGVGPEKIVDVVALMGDSVDNIPGVKGIGEKTAVSLIQKYGSAENVIRMVDDIRQEKLRIAIKDSIATIRLNRELALLHSDLDITLDLDAVRLREPDYARLLELYSRLEFKSLIKELPKVSEPAPEYSSVEIDDSQVFDAFPQATVRQLVVGGESLEELTLYATEGPYKNSMVHVGNPGANTLAVLENPAIGKVGHDLKTLALKLQNDGVFLQGYLFDTMIAAYVVNPAIGGYSLNELSWHFLKQIVSPDAVDAKRAVSLVVQLRPLLETRLREQDSVPLFTSIEMPLIAVLARMETAGIRADADKLAALSKELERRLIGLIKDIYAHAGSEFNINSPKQLSSVLFEKLKLPVIKKTKTGYSTDEEVLRRLASHHELPALLLSYRQLMKLKSTYVDTLPALIRPGTGRIHTSFNQVGTETGRLSSSNPNMQNIPVRTDEGKCIRQSIIAFDAESLLVSCDYSQIELRILAHFSQDANLLEAFRLRKDVHRMTAALIYGVEESEVDDQMRDMAKRVNFGISYGLTSFGLARDLQVPLEQAQAFIDAYFSRYPAIKDYIARQVESARKQGYVTTLFGRRRYLDEINSKNMAVRQLAERQAVNSPIQGSASDLIKKAMVQMDQAVVKQGFHAGMLLQIHDELLFNVPKKEMKAFIPCVREIMEGVCPSLSVALTVDIKAGGNWQDMQEVTGQ